MKILSIRENPEIKDKGIAYFQEKWANETTEIIYEDAINHAITSTSTLSQWYVLFDEVAEKIVGCAGLIPNDFISRMDLYPWLCALYVEKDYRGKRLSEKLIERVKYDTKQAGFAHLYLPTDHVGLYEKFGFVYIGDGYHPWGESSRIYEIEL